MNEAMKVEVRADFAQFEKALLQVQNKADAGLNRLEQRVVKSNQKVRAEAKGLGGAFGELTRSMTGAMGGLPGLGIGMGAVGLAGGAAAIGVGALVASLRGLEGAAKWADALAATAARIGVTSEALQELRYAADETDVPISTLESGLEALNASLGAFKTGIGAGRIKPIFEALGLTQADLVNVHNAAELMPILADRLGQISDRATQVQLAKKLGGDGLLPLLREGSAGINRMTNEGRNLGLVMSNEVVDGLADTDRALERNKQQIDANVREMQAGLAPFFVWASGELAKLSRGIADIFNGLRNVEGRTDRVLEGQVQTGQERVNRAMRQQRDTGAPLSAVQEGWIRDLAAARAELNSRRQARSREAAPDAADRARNDFVPDLPSANAGGSRRGGGGGADPAARAAREALQHQRRFDDDLAAANDATLQAQSQLATTTEQRASIAITLLDSEAQQRRVQLERAVLDGDLTAAQRDRLAAADEAVRLAKQEIIAASLRHDQSEAEAKAQSEIRAFTMSLLEVRRSNAGTLEAAHAIDLELLALRQQERRQALERALLVEGITDVERRTLEALLARLGEIEGEETKAAEGAASPGVQAARDVLGAIGAGANGQVKADQDHLAALAEIDAQMVAGTINHQKAMDARAQIDQAYWQQRLTGEGSMLDAIAGLQNSSIKELAALGKAAAIAQATIDGYLAIQNAWARVPFPANIAAAAFVAAQTATNIAAIAGVGFKSGGYTGDGPEGAVVGPVHGKEYVFDAAATRRIGKPALDAMRKGGPLPANMSAPLLQNLSMGVVESAGRRGTTINMRVDLKGATGDRQIMAAVERAATGAMEEAVRQANRAAPGAVRKAEKYRLGGRSTRGRA